MKPRRSVRLRLTLWYAALFLASGTVLLTTSYIVVREQFSEPFRVEVPPPSTVEPGSASQQYGFTERISQADARRLEAALDERNRRALRAVLLYFVGALGLTTVGSLGAGWVLAGRALRPVARITATARRVSDENLGERIELDGPDDELKELAETFDAMLEKLDRAFESQRRFVAHASHELRTPLSVMRTALDVTLEDPDASRADVAAMAATLRDAVSRSEQLAERLLTLAAGDRGLERRETVDLADVCREVWEELAPRAHDRRLDAELDRRPAPTAGDRILLRQLVANLVDNAIRHNRDGGRLRIATGSNAEGVFVTVTNDGARIPPAELDGLLAPFRRLDGDHCETAAGFGLGLSIVDCVTRAHHGELQLRARPEGGLEVKVVTPSW
jgi:signal transduction histidine kinase